MQHMFWTGSSGSELYCDADITSDLGQKSWENAIASAEAGNPFIIKPLFVRTVLVDFTEAAMRRFVLSFDPNEAMQKDGLERLLENDARMRRRIAGS